MSIIVELFKDTILAVTTVRAYNISLLFQINICITTHQLNFLYLIYKITLINSI